MDNYKAIILLASERSGSNLLRVLLGNHHLISAPIAPHFLNEFYHIRHYYGDLRKESNIKKLIIDMLSVANHPYHNWNLNQEDIKLHGKCNSIISAMDFLYKQKANIENKHHYCSKGIHSFNFIDQLRAEIKNIKFIHLVRDPRDHVASWMKRIDGPLTPYDAIIKWKKEQDTFIDAIYTKGLNAISIKYEDLISNTEKTMTKILNYLELPIDNNCFSIDTDKSKNLKWNPYWENLSKPIIKENKNKFFEELSYETLNLIETIAKNEMIFFGYKTETACNWKIPKDFDKILTKQRKEKLKAEKKRVDKLEDKKIFLKNLKEKRKKEWQKTHRQNYSLKTEGRNTLKKRLRYISYAIIGENFTNKVISKIKK